MAVASEKFSTELRKTITDSELLPIPEILVVASYALSEGLEVALCTTIRVFASTAIDGLPETRLAIYSGGCGTYKTPCVIDLDRARVVILTAGVSLDRRLLN